jgi:hypothetical protein
VLGRVLRTGLLGKARALFHGLGPKGEHPSREEHLEFRPDHRGEFDELVARFADGMIFAEMMDDSSIFIDISWDDGRYCHWWLGTEKKKLWHNFEHGKDEPPRYTAQGIDTKPWLPDYGKLAAETLAK